MKQNGLETIINEDKKITFKSWLKQQNKRNDPVGDISRDFLLDECGQNLESVKSISKHMIEKHNICDAALEALKEATHEYESQKTNKVITTKEELKLIKKTKLLPCPFCGQAGKILRRVVRCEHCNINIELPVENWNTRSHPIVWYDSSISNYTVVMNKTVYELEKENNQ